AVREFDPDAPAGLALAGEEERSDERDQAEPEPSPINTIGAAVREQVVIGPQARGATSSPSNGNGHGRNGNGKPEPEPLRPPPPTGPPKLVRITFPRTGDQEADTQRL